MPSARAKKTLAAAGDAFAIGEPHGPRLPAEAPSSAAPIDTTLPIGSVFPSPLNPRKAFDPDRLAELAENIKRVGLLQPILVRPRRAGDFVGSEEHVGNPDAEIYEIVAGERRYRAI